MRHHQNRASRPRHDLFRHATHNDVVETGPAMRRHHDHVDALGSRLLDDILVGRAEFNRAAHFDQIDAIGEIVGEKLIQQSPALFQHVVVSCHRRRSVFPLTANVDGMVNNDFGARIARHLQGITNSDLG